MRKLICCCSAFGLLSLGSLLTATYYASQHPHSLVGRCVLTAADASVILHPLAGLTTRMMRGGCASAPVRPTAGGDEECVPADPQPVAEEKPAHVDEFVKLPAVEAEQAVAVVINESNPVPPAPAQTPATIDMGGMQPAAPVEDVCPVVMPYCTDENEQPMTPPTMPRADADEVKPAGAAEEAEEGGVFKAWMKLFESGEEKQSDAAEELPAPKEDEPSPQPRHEKSEDEPKCQEDAHLHDQYSGCPYVTCPYTGKSYPKCPPKKAGKEEASEEPPHEMKPHPKKSHRGEKDECPRTQGVDTMEYRPSDGGLNEYGNSPQQ